MWISMQSLLYTIILRFDFKYNYLTEALFSERGMSTGHPGCSSSSKILQQNRRQSIRASVFI